LPSHWIQTLRDTFLSRRLISTSEISSDRSTSISSDPESGWTLARIGQIHLRRGRNGRALEYLERAIEREPESSSGQWARAMRAGLQGRREEGLAILRKSKEATMVDGEQRYHFANIHCLLGDQDGCLRGLQAAVNGGFFNYPFLLRDSFLDPVRNDRTFQRILAQARAKHESFKGRFFPRGAQPNIGQPAAQARRR
jgi:tetratricopeptide (TPR) repeat protein